MADPVSALSLGLALMFGTAGQPHILMRFFTVNDAREARKSVFYATGFMGYFYFLTFIIGFGAILLVGANPAFKDSAGALLGGNNMAAIHLANAVGGNFFLGFISAVAFATILAVVAGLTLAGASAVSHDLYASVIKAGNATGRDELRVSKITVVVLMIIGPTIWVQVLGHAKPIYPYEYPALFSMLVAFIGTWLFSITDHSAQGARERELFLPQFIRSQTGIGISTGADH